jgi:hypothetical protein
MDALAEFIEGVVRVVTGIRDETQDDYALDA